MASLAFNQTFRGRKLTWALLHNVEPGSACRRGTNVPFEEISAANKQPVKEQNSAKEEKEFLNDTRSGVTDLPSRCISNEGLKDAFELRLAAEQNQKATTCIAYRK